jgi:predicted adenine nucleotide alpha hydrolase (AANH) superfamily ATPase
MKRHKEAPLQTLDQKSPVLMHTCCAPCSGDIINTVKNAGISFTLFFYNPNIHPKKEYDLRKEEKFYQQQYCGCAYSLRDTNQWRQSQGRGPVELGKDYYHPHDLPAKQRPRPQ